MQICLVSTNILPIPSFYGGAIEMLAYRFSKELIKRGHEISIISVAPPTHHHSSYIKENGLDIYYINIPPTLYLRGLVFNLKIFSLIHNIVSNDSLIHVYASPAFWGPYFAKKLGTNKIVLSEHNFGPWMKHTPSELKQRVMHNMDLSLASFAVSHADHVIAVSNSLKEAVLSHVNVRCGFTVIPNAVDTDMFNPSVSEGGIRNLYNIKDKPLVLFVGRVSPEKGLEYLLQAFRFVKELVEDAKLLIVGPLSHLYNFETKDVFPSDDYARRIYKMRHQFKLDNDIEFTGSIHHDEMPRFYAACDVLVLSSIHEAFGLTVLEAMSCGKPVVATNVGGLPEIIEDGVTGILVPARDPKSLSDAIVRIINNSKLASKMGREGRKRALRYYTWDNVLKKTVEMYTKILEND